MPPDGVLGFSFAQNGDFVASRGQTDAKGLLDGAEVFVGDSEQVRQPGVGQGDGLGGVWNLYRSCGFNGTTRRKAARNAPPATSGPRP